MQSYLLIVIFSFGLNRSSIVDVPIALSSFVSYTWFSHSDAYTHVQAQECTICGCSSEVAPLLLWESGKVYEFQIVSAGIVQQDTSLPSVRALPSRLAAGLQHRLKLASGFSTRQSVFSSSQLGGVPAPNAMAKSRALGAKSGEKPPSDLGEPRSLGQRQRDSLPPQPLCSSPDRPAFHLECVS